MCTTTKTPMNIVVVVHYYMDRESTNAGYCLLVLFLMSGAIGEAL